MARVRRHFDPIAGVYRIGKFDRGENGVLPMVYIPKENDYQVALELMNRDIATAQETKRRAAKKNTGFAIVRRDFSGRIHICNCLMADIVGLPIELWNNAGTDSPAVEFISEQLGYQDDDLEARKSIYCAINDNIQAKRPSPTRPGKLMYDSSPGILMFPDDPEFMNRRYWLESPRLNSKTLSAWQASQAKLLAPQVAAVMPKPELILIDPIAQLLEASKPKAPKA